MRRKKFNQNMQKGDEQLKLTFAQTHKLEYYPYDKYKSPYTETPTSNFLGRGVGGGWYFGVNFGHLKSEVFHLGGRGAFWSEIPERGFLENLAKNLLFEVNGTETCLCITDSLSHTTYVETNDHNEF